MILKMAAGGLVTLIVLLWAFKAYRDAHYFDNYDPRAPLNIAVQDTVEVNKETPEAPTRSPGLPSTDTRVRRSLR